MGKKYQWKWASFEDLSKLLGTPFGVKLELQDVDQFPDIGQAQILELHQLVPCRMHSHCKPSVDVIPLVLYCDMGRVKESSRED